VPAAGALLLAAAGAVLIGCRGEHPEYRTGNRTYDRQTRELLALLEHERGGADQRFMIVQEISKTLRAAGAPRRQLMFLATYVETHPADPYNAYYLMAVAEGYRDLGQDPLAAHYYERILRNYADAVVQGRSIHLTALGELIALEDDPQRLVGLYKELIGRFGDAIDVGRSHFFLGRAYEAVGEWEQAVAAYQVYLQHADTDIPGVPYGRREVITKVNLHFSDKSWVMDDLGTLVDELKRAVALRDRRALQGLRSQAGFFAMSWEQQVADDAVAPVFDLSAFSLSKVRFDEAFDADSNADEAFIRTTGWSYRVKTWYLYFRRVDFKADPEIDGGWEWAGIFLGEKR
jgi:tetratricopeptide (TPR) repeat protein